MYNYYNDFELLNEPEKQKYILSSDSLIINKTDSAVKNLNSIVNPKILGFIPG